MPIIASCGLDMVLPGSVALFGGLIVPDGWMECNGTTLSRQNYADLFSRIGIAYGADDGVTFKIPDFRMRLVVADNGSTYQRGMVGGASSISLAVSQLKAHAHGVGTMAFGSSSANHAHSISVVAGDAHTHGGTSPANSGGAGALRYPAERWTKKINKIGGYVSGWSFVHFVRSNDESPHTHGVVTSGAQDVAHLHSLTSVQSHAHNHALTGSSGNNSTTHAPVDLRQPYGVAKYMIRVK